MSKSTREQSCTQRSVEDSVALCQSTRLSSLQPGFNSWAGMWESSLLSLQMSGGFPLGFLPPPERFKISSYKPIRVGRVLDLHSGDVKHTFIYLFLLCEIPQVSVLSIQTQWPILGGPGARTPDPLPLQSTNV